MYLIHCSSQEIFLQYKKNTSQLLSKQYKKELEKTIYHNHISLINIHTNNYRILTKTQT